MTIQVKNFNNTQKNIFIAALTFMLSFEKKHCDEKFEFLKIQAIRCGYDQRKLKTKSTVKATEIASELNKIKDIAVKRYIILQMILLTIAGHELSDKEVDVIYAIGTKAGINIDKIDDFFLWAAKGIEWQIEGAKIVEEDL